MVVYGCVYTNALVVRGTPGCEGGIGLSKGIHYIVPYSFDSTPTQIALHFGQKVRVGVLSNITQFLESTPTTFFGSIIG